MILNQCEIVVVNFCCCCRSCRNLLFTFVDFDFRIIISLDSMIFHSFEMICEYWWWPINLIARKCLRVFVFVCFGVRWGVFFLFYDNDVKSIILVKCRPTNQSTIFMWLTLWYCWIDRISLDKRQIPCAHLKFKH